MVGLECPEGLSWSIVGEGRGSIWGVRKSRVARESGVATPFSAGRGALRLLEPYILVMLGSPIPAFSTFFGF